MTKPAEWFKSREAAQTATNVLAWQSELGGWPKNVDTTAPRITNPAHSEDLKPTFDNGATTSELRFLARLCAANPEPKYRAAFEKGLDYILKAQYANGGWPQNYPPGRSYARYITFNDDAMVRVMTFLRECASSNMCNFIEPGRRARVRESFERGVECILKCQVRVNGRLTAWCAQHDETDFSPRPARTYELASLSGAESVGIVRLLMSVDRPGPEIIRSICAAVDWFHAAKLTGIKVVRVPEPQAPRSLDKRVIEDRSAPPMWARFYDIRSGRPIFCDRDGVPKTKLSEIGYERRNSYDWLDYWPQPLLEKEYPAWAAKWLPASGRP